jgi:hypothetical protein
MRATRSHRFSTHVSAPVQGAPRLEVRSILTLVNGPELKSSATVDVLAAYMMRANPTDVARMEVRDAGGKWQVAHVRVGHMIGVRGV